MGKVLRWLELGGEQQWAELLLADAAVKYFAGSMRIWLLDEEYNKWMSGRDWWLLVLPEILNGTAFCHSKGTSKNKCLKINQSIIV